MAWLWVNSGTGGLIAHCFHIATGDGSKIRQGEYRTDQTRRVTKTEELIEDDGVADERFELKNADKLRGALIPEERSGRVHAIYLAAVGLATIGWFWFIAWCALQLV
jgi:hypothetical protein